MFSTKLFILLACSLAITSAFTLDDIIMGGKPYQFTEEECKDSEEGLQVFLDNMAASVGVHYKVSKINSASIQFAAIVLTKINADLINSSGEVSNCNTSLWIQLSFPNGLEIKVDCEGQKPLDWKYSPNEKN